MKVYQKISHLSNAIENCKRNKNWDWHARHQIRIGEIIDEYLPSGSGFDADINLKYCDRKKMIFKTHYHCMDEHGGYDGWIAVAFILTPSFIDFNLKINWRGYRGKYKGQLIDYFYDLWSDAFNQEVKDEKHDTRLMHTG